MNASVHSRTPSLAVIDGRGLPIRQVAYLRTVAGEPPEALVTRQQHDVAGRLVAQHDPRLPIANATTVYTLDGAAVLTDSVDSGRRHVLAGLAGEPLQRWDERGHHWRSTFDSQLRVVAMELSGNGQNQLDTFAYAEGAESATHNRRGKLIQQVDPSGSLDIRCYAFTGQSLEETRTFHDSAAFTSKHVFSPLGVVLEQTDAGEHCRRSRYGLGGHLKQVDLWIKGIQLQPVLLDAQYNANDQIVEQRAGNGVLNQWTYDPADGRLHTQCSQAGEKLLQSFVYFYDRVGNVVRVEDRIFEPVWFANQRIDGHREFNYDSLYRLIRATGYDDAAPSEIPGWPTPTDPKNRLNYTQCYSYDTGHNLTKLCHVRDGNTFTRQMCIDPNSNRGVLWKSGDAPPDFDTLFDPHGNQQTLKPGPTLPWNARDELESVPLVIRKNSNSDAEHYRYSQGQRVFKCHEWFTGTTRHFHQVRYLPGLEIRTKDDGEELHVISLGNARCLHWITGRPGSIENNQMRYSQKDHLGSCVMELDQQADITSKEGYYPFGGTAWLAARNEVEVRYKFIRYSGKEMDVSGLYYYGARYYAPWLQRWVSADPAGAVDGLNLYGFVGNNPLSYFDAQGQQRTSSELLTIVSDYEDLLATATRRLDTSIYQLSHLNSTKDIYRSSGKRAVLTLLNVLASAITAGTVFTAATVVGTLATINPVTGLAIGVATAAIAADVTGAEIDKLGEDNAFGYKLLPDSADYDIGNLTEEAKSKGWKAKIKSFVSKYDPRTTDGNKESLIVGGIGAADVLTGGTHLEKFLAFFRLSAEVTEAFNDSLGQHDLDLVEQGIESAAAYLTSRMALSDLALEELEGLGREHIATAQGTRYRLAQAETVVLGKMNRALELLPRVSAHLQQKSAAKG
jgi:insecticidal toxin complex protein TccC